MSLVDETFEVYVQMRTAGKDAKGTLEALRVRISLLRPADRVEMVRRVKAWEAQRNGKITPPKPVEPRPAVTSLPKAQIPCPRCGKLNTVGELFCVHCGNFLRGDINPHETTRLEDPEVAAHASDYFGAESTLMLVVSGNNFTYTIQPQRYKHETVIGRGEGGTMRPDVDLSDHNAGEMGVSRLHVALQYNAKNNLLSISDMKSANGTYINGQKLYPQEVRVLRDGDELRLGRLVLRAYFKHPERTS